MLDDQEYKFVTLNRWALAVRSDLVHSSPLEGSSRTRYSFSGNVSPVLIRMTFSCQMLTNYFRAPTLVQASVFPVNSHLMTDLRYEIASWVGVGIISDRVNFLMRFQQKKRCVRRFYQATAASTEGPLSSLAIGSPCPANAPGWLQSF